MKVLAALDFQLTNLFLLIQRRNDLTCEINVNTAKIGHFCQLGSVQLVHKQTASFSVHVRTMESKWQLL